VTAIPPTIAVPASANPNPVVGSSTNLSVLGADIGGESSLNYTWSTNGTPPAPVIFSVNGSNAAKNCKAGFTQPGTYNLLATVTNTAGLAATSPVTVTVSGPAIAVNKLTLSLPGGTASLTDLTAQLFPAPTTNVTVTISQTGGYDSMYIGATELLSFSPSATAPQYIQLVGRPRVSLTSDSATITLSAPGYASASIAITILPTDTTQTISPLLRATSSSPNSPGLAFSSTQGNTNVPVLQAVGSRSLTGTAGSTVDLNVTAGANSSANVTFVCMSGGYVYVPANVPAGASPPQTPSLTIPTTNGVATARFYVGQSGKMIVLASSPTCSGQVRFVIKAP
jgi:hypothetical protein